MRVIYKTATYSTMHIVIAFCVAWAVSLDFKIALGISLIEPAIQIAAFYFHEKIWNRKSAKDALSSAEKKKWDMIPPCCHATAELIRKSIADKKE